MVYKILADSTIALHFGWIVFILGGFFLTVRAVFFRRHRYFFNRWLLRSIHLGGILFVATLGLFGQDCPLTNVENALRYKADPTSIYTGSFIAHYLEQLVYPGVNVIVLRAAAAGIALFTLVTYFALPPWRKHK